MTSAVAEKQTVTTWQEQLAKIKKAYEQYPDNAQTGLPVVSNDVLTRKNERIYRQRIVQLQKSINNNKHLKGFSLVTPVPTDLATLSLNNYAALHAFLKGLHIAKVIHTQRVRPFTLAVRIQGEQQGAVELWIDVPTHNVYLMSDNFYSTAEGKYGLHLR